MWVCFNRRVVLKLVVVIFFTLKTGIIFVVPSLTQLVKSMYVYFCIASFKNSYCFFSSLQVRLRNGLAWLEKDWNSI